jgi:asparagine N-glycosylation enzyme membrane subunit Stt3
LRTALTTLLIALLAGLLVYLTRRRLKLALTVGAAAYFILLPIRLAFSAGEVADRLDTFVWPALAIFVVWLILTRLSVEYQKRKPPPAPKRPARGLFGRIRRQ